MNEKNYLYIEKGAEQNKIQMTCTDLWKIGTLLYKNAKLKNITMVYLSIKNQGNTYTSLYVKNHLKVSWQQMFNLHSKTALELQIVRWLLYKKNEVMAEKNSHDPINKMSMILNIKLAYLSNKLSYDL
mgnify:CR=1 FL=1